MSTPEDTPPTPETSMGGTAASQAPRAAWDGLPVEWNENVGTNKAANR